VDENDGEVEAVVVIGRPKWALLADGIDTGVSIGPLF
jgi:hypothetical protein